MDNDDKFFLILISIGVLAVAVFGVIDNVYENRKLRIEKYASCVSSPSRNKEDCLPLLD